MHSFWQSTWATPVPDLPFTHDGLEPILQSARTNYQLGTAYASCEKPEEAAKKFQLASAASAPDQVLVGLAGSSRNYPVLTRSNGESVCKLLSHRQRVVSTPVAIPVGGTTLPVHSLAL